MSSEPTTTTLALAVWPTPPRRRPRYLAASQGRHPIQPELAARAILNYSDPGDLVVDPCCGVGTVLIEAITQGRRAIGVEADRSRAALAIANISHARQHGAPGRAAVLEGTPERLPRLLATAAPLLNQHASKHIRRHPAGSVQLLLTATPSCLDSQLLAAWTPVLAPGGFLLLVHDHQQHSRRPGLAPIVAAAEQTGLAYWQHVIAFRSSPDDTDTLVHVDVLAFRKAEPETHEARDRRRQRELAA